MNRTQITFKDQIITLVFGTWVMGQLIKSGYSLESFQSKMKENPFEFIPKIVYLAAVNGLPNKDKEAYVEHDFSDWLDEVGGMGSDELGKVLKCFTNSLGTDVPKKKTSAAKAQPSSE